MDRISGFTGFFCGFVIANIVVWHISGGEICFAKLQFFFVFSKMQFIYG